MSFNLISTFLIAIALAMDAFSVSMTKGFTQKNITKPQIIYYGLFFGGFQALMPILGYFCGTAIASIVASLASIIGFVLLLAIGLNMIRESLSSDDDEITDNLNKLTDTLDFVDIVTEKDPVDQKLKLSEKITSGIWPSSINPARILREIIFRELGKPNEKKKDKEDF